MLLEERQIENLAQEPAGNMSRFRFCVAPMMDWTDRHCRVLHRLLSRKARLYTEMLTTGAVLHGDRGRLLGFDASEHPVALQLGGSEPEALAEAARIGAAWGYDEINLNVGCPSDRVQAGRFGACLMAEPALVADCVRAMHGVVNVPVTVKCRLGVDDQDPEESLPALARHVMDAGCTTLIVHARKAWLKGLSPKENRNVPPLDYDLVYRLKERLPQLEVIINGGLSNLEDAETHLQHVDGVMLGRAAYQSPYLLAEVDRRLFGSAARPRSRVDIVAAYTDYMRERLDDGVPLKILTHPLIGLYQGQPRARAWRRILAEGSCRQGAGLEIIEAALDAVTARAPQCYETV